jgi:hypothetical protein
MIVQQIAFVLVLATAIFFIRKRVLFIRNTIKLGKEKKHNRPQERTLQEHAIGSLRSEEDV